MVPGPQAFPGATLARGRNTLSHFLAVPGTDNEAGFMESVTWPPHCRLGQTGHADDLAGGQLGAVVSETSENVEPPGERGDEVGILSG